MRYAFLVFISAIIFASSCKEQAKNSSITNENIASQESRENAVHRDYKGKTSLQRWKEIKRNTWSEGQRQSPANITAQDALPKHSRLTMPDARYIKDTTTHEATNKGYSFQYNFD